MLFKLFIFIFLLMVVVAYFVRFVLMLLFRGLSKTNTWVDSHKNVIYVIVGLLSFAGFFVMTIKPTLEAFISTNNWLLDFNKKELPSSDEKNVPYSIASRVGNDLTIELGIQKNPLYKDPFSYKAIVSGYELSKYHIADIPHATTLLDTLFNKINYFMLDNTNRELQIYIDILGQADNVPSKLSLYSGDLGVINNIKYYSYADDVIKQKTFIPNKTPLTNEDFALLRAYNVYQTIYNKIKYSSSFYKLNTKISDKSGSEERLVIIRVRIKDAIKKKYYEMNEFQRQVFNTIN